MLVRLQGVDAGLRQDEARAAVARAEANLRLAESQNTLAQTTVATIRVAARHRRRLDDGRGSIAHRRRNIGAERRDGACVPGAVQGTARARRKGCRRRRRRRAVLGIHQPTARVARRVRAAVDCGRHAAQDRPAAAATDDTRRPGGARSRRADRDSHRRRVQGAVVHRPHQRRESRNLDRGALVPRRGARAESGGVSQARACSRWRQSIRARR